MTRYAISPTRDARAFDILQNMPPELAQAFFWNFTSRTQRREAILAWKADQEIDEQSDAFDILQKEVK